MVRYTVIIPAYNAEKTLGRCLLSLLSQNRRDIRILLINDGSTDGTEALALEYCGKSPLIEYHHQPNAGVSAARNLGLSLAQSEFVTFVDSDDHVMPGYFEVLDTIGSGDLLVFDRCHTGGSLRDDSEVFRRLEAMTDPADILELLMDSKKIMQPVNKCFRLSLIRQHGIRFPESLHIGEDFAFCMAYALRCGSIAVSREKAYCIDVSDGGSLSRRYRPDLSEQLSAAADSVCASIRSAGLPQATADRLLARLDELDSRNLLMSIAEDFKRRGFRISGCAMTARVCRDFGREFSPVRLNPRHRLLRRLRRLRLYPILYLLAWLARGRQYRAVRKEAHHV